MRSSIYSSPQATSHHFDCGHLTRTMKFISWLLPFQRHFPTPLLTTTYVHVHVKATQHVDQISDRFPQPKTQDSVCFHPISLCIFLFCFHQHFSCNFFFSFQGRRMNWHNNPNLLTFSNRALSKTASIHHCPSMQFLYMEKVMPQNPMSSHSALWMPFCNTRR